MPQLLCCSTQYMQVIFIPSRAIACKTLKEQQVLVVPAHPRKDLLHALLHRLRPADEHQRLAILWRRADLALKQTPVHPALQTLPPGTRPCEGVNQLALLPILRGQIVQFLPTQYILLNPIPVQHQTPRLILAVLHDSPEHLEYRRDPGPGADHDEPPHPPLLPADRTPAPAEILELAHGPLKLDKVSERDRVQRLRHPAPLPVRGVVIDLDQHVQPPPL